MPYEEIYFQRMDENESKKLKEEKDANL